MGSRGGSASARVALGRPEVETDCSGPSAASSLDDQHLVSLGPSTFADAYPAQRRQFGVVAREQGFGWILAVLGTLDHRHFEAPHRASREGDGELIDAGIELVPRDREQGDVREL